VLGQRPQQPHLLRSPDRGEPLVGVGQADWPHGPRFLVLRFIDFAVEGRQQFSYHVGRGLVQLFEQCGGALQRGLAFGSGHAGEHALGHPEVGRLPHLPQEPVRAALAVAADVGRSGAAGPQESGG
jgi:hypothetical protein